MSNSIQMSSELEERIRSAAALLADAKRVRVISHYDADGISSAAVLGGMLTKASKPFHATMSRSLDSKLIERIGAEGNELVIFADMGSGQLELVSQLRTKTIVLDHHKTSGDIPGVVHVNPSMYGVNGTTEVSGATTAFLLAQYVDDWNWQLSPCALAGAYGDMQHLGGYKGVNLQIVEKAVEKGILSERKMLSLQGSNLSEAIGGSSEPYFRGYSGRGDLVSALCSQIHLDAGRPFSEYTEAESRKLASVLTLMLASAGCDYDQMSQIVSTQHISTSTGIAVSELSSLANACGRSGEFSIGMATELGDRDAAAAARRLRSEYNTRILERLIALEEGIEQKAHIQCFRSDDAPLAGALCGLYMSFIGEKSKPTVAYSLADDSYKISARGTRALVRHGLDLAAGLSSAAKLAGGVGGGHVIASGATIPRDTLARFLDALDDQTGKQLQS